MYVSFSQFKERQFAQLNLSNGGRGVNVKAKTYYGFLTAPLSNEPSADVT